MKNQSKQKLKDKLDKAKSYNKHDHLLNILKASSSITPIVGGILSSLISDYIPRTREKRIIEFLEALASDLSNLSDKIDECDFNNDRFINIFTRTLRAVAETSQHEKIEAFKSFLITSIFNPTIDEDVEAMYLTRLKEMTVSHLRVLALFGYPRRYVVNEFDIFDKERLYESTTTIVCKAIANNLPQLSQSSIVLSGKSVLRHVHAILEDLIRWGFIDNINLYDSEEDRKSRLGAEDLVDFIDGLLVSFGRDFLNYVKSKDSQ